MKLFLTAFGLHNPYIQSRVQSHSPIPVAVETAHGFDLDYSALLVAEALVIDQTAFNFIETRQQTYLHPMWHSLQTLLREGLLQISDFGDLSSKYHSALCQRTELLLAYPEPWLQIAREQWHSLRNDFEDFANRFSDPAEVERDAAHSGVVSFLEREVGKFDAAECRRLTTLLESKKLKLSHTERVEVREVLKPLVCQVLLNDLIRQRLKSPFLDWDDAQAFHDHLHNLSQWPDEQDSEVASGPTANAACKLSLVIPELLPERIEDVVRFIRNRKAVESLRNELWALLREGSSVSPDWIRRIQLEASKAQLRAESRSRVIKWLGRAAGVLIPGGSLAGEVAEWALYATEDLADNTVEGRTKRDFNWYYALQKIKIQSAK